MTTRENDLTSIVSALCYQAGGELCISRECLVAAPSIHNEAEFETVTDPATGDLLIRLLRPHEILEGEVVPGERQAIAR